jgi:hypothetical protein
VALLCERYDELSGTPMAEIRDDLIAGRTGGCWPWGSTQRVASNV